MKMEMDSREVLEFYAKLKKIPFSKVIRNISRDFVQEAFKHVPLSIMTGKPVFYCFRTTRGKKVYVPIGMRPLKYKGRGKANKPQRDAEQAMLEKHIVRINKGWSRAGWIGVFRSLGMSSEKAERNKRNLPSVVEFLGKTKASGDEHRPVMNITVDQRFNKWGKGSDRVTDSIIAAGFDACLRRTIKDLNRLLKNPSTQI